MTQANQPITRLRGLFAESAYYILPMAKRFRFRKGDFVLVPKSRTPLPTPFLVVRMSSRGAITVRPYGIANVHQVVQDIIERARNQHRIPVTWNPRMLWPQRKNLRLEHVLAPEGLTELRRLGEP